MRYGARGYGGILFLLSAVVACDAVESEAPVDACGGACKDNQVCVAEACRDKVCEPFAVHCKDSATLSTCNGNGTELREEPCGQGSACVQDTCTPTVCVPDTYFCGADGQRKLCSGDGLSYDTEACDDGFGCDGAGECVLQICTPGAVTCLTEGERDVERCNPAGTAIVAGRCDANEVCVGDQCRRRICQPGNPVCVNSTRSATCDGHGTGFVDEVACDSATGARCDFTTGACASACEVAGNAKSYIGCDYWFAITDNAANDQSNASAIDDQADYFSCEPPAGKDLFPSAVVIANTSALTARVTLRDGSGAVVTLADQRHVQELPMPSPSFGGDWSCQSYGNSSATVDSKVLVGSQTATVLNGQTVQDLEIPAGATAQLLIVSPALDGTQIAAAGYHLVSSIPVSAYLFNPICCNFSYSNDASLLIPRTAWRTGYFALSAPHLGGSSGGVFLPGSAGRPAGVAIIAAENDTDIALRLGPNQSANQFNVTGLPSGFSGGELRTTLNAGQVLQLETKFASARADVTGLLVAGNKPIGVISFHECTYVPQNKAACDHLEEMMLPIETWGTEYLAVMPKLRNPDVSSESNQERMYYRLLSAADGNRVVLAPKPSDLEGAHDDVTDTCPVDSGGAFTLNEGQYCELGSRNSFTITAEAPLLVVGIFSGQDSTGLVFGSTHAGDPSLAQLVPVDQFRRDYSFLTPDTYFADYVTVVFKPTSDIVLDGHTIDPATAQQLGSNQLVETAILIPGTQFVRITVKLSPGAHEIHSADPDNPAAEGERFAIFNYGYDDYVSYAYPGGLDLIQTSEYGNLPTFP